MIIALKPIIINQTQKVPHQVRFLGTEETIKMPSSTKKQLDASLHIEYDEADEEKIKPLLDALRTVASCVAQSRKEPEKATYLGKPVVIQGGPNDEQMELLVQWPLTLIEDENKILGYYGLVLELLPKELPFRSPAEILPRFNVGQSWRAKAREGEERRAETAILDRLRLWAGTTQHGEAAAEVTAILDSNLERGG